MHVQFYILLSFGQDRHFIFVYEKIDIWQFSYKWEFSSWSHWLILDGRVLIWHKKKSTWCHKMKIAIWRFICNLIAPRELCHVSVFNCSDWQRTRHMCIYKWTNRHSHLSLVLSKRHAGMLDELNSFWARRISVIIVRCTLSKHLRVVIGYNVETTRLSRRKEACGQSASCTNNRGCQSTSKYFRKENFFFLVLQ